MVARTNKKRPVEIGKQHIYMLNEYVQLVAWTRELQAEGREREASSTREAAEKLRERIEQIERDHRPLD